MAGCVLKSFMYLLCICIIYVFIMYRIQKLNFQDQDFYCIATAFSTCDSLRNIAVICDL